MVLIDFRKAFYSIGHDIMFKILHAYGIPPRILALIKLCNLCNLKEKVVSPDGDTDLFSIHAGVMQGDILAPFLFVIALDYGPTQAIAGREEELGFSLSPRKSKIIRDFADDIVLLCNQVEQAAKLVHTVERECKNVGLILNYGKTKAMYFNVDVAPLSNIDDEPICQALTEIGEQDFQHLGSWCSKARDIKTRKALAWRSLHKMDKIWKSQFYEKLKIMLFRARTESILLYGSQTWLLTLAEEMSLTGTYTRILRMVKKHFFEGQNYQQRAVWQPQQCSPCRYGT